MSSGPCGWLLSNSGVGARANELQRVEPAGSNLVSVNRMDIILSGACVTARQAVDLMANLGVNVDPV